MSTRTNGRLLLLQLLYLVHSIYSQVWNGWDFYNDRFSVGFVSSKLTLVYYHSYCPLPMIFLDPPKLGIVLKLEAEVRITSLVFQGL